MKTSHPTPSKSSKLKKGRHFGLLAAGSMGLLIWFLSPQLTVGKEVPPIGSHLVSPLTQPQSPKDRASDPTWKTGPAFEKRLEEPIDLAWTKSALRDALRQIGQTREIALLLDRRIDPDQRITWKSHGLPLRDTLEALATHLGAEVSFFGPAVYLGPPDAAKRLRTVAALARQKWRGMPPVQSKIWLRKKPLHWNDLAEPRGLLISLAEEAGCQIDRLEKIPHDLWAEGSLPPLTLIDRLSLVLIQFDLTFEPVETGGRVDRIRLVELPERPTITKTYPGGPQANERVKTWKTTWPEADIHLRGKRIEVIARIEIHQQLADQNRPTNSKKTTKPTEKKDSIDLARVRVDHFAITAQPVEAVLKYLAKRFELQLELTDVPRTDLEKRISISREKATVDSLFEAIAEEAGLTYRREGKTVEFRPISTANP